MKKVLIFLAIIAIIVIIIIVNYFSYMTEYNSIISENKEYEQYRDKEINGLQLATIINKTVDKNTKNDINKDESGLFISNGSNSIEIEIYMTDNENTYKMEKIHDAGTEQFVQYYGNINFKCSKIEYHKNTGKVSYILFEQIPIS